MTGLGWSRPPEQIPMFRVDPKKWWAGIAWLVTVLPNWLNYFSFSGVVVILVILLVDDERDHQGGEEGNSAEIGSGSSDDPSEKLSIKTVVVPTDRLDDEREPSTGPAVEPDPEPATVGGADAVTEIGADSRTDADDAERISNPDRAVPASNGFMARIADLTRQLEDEREKVADSERRNREIRKRVWFFRDNGGNRRVMVQIPPRGEEAAGVRIQLRLETRERANWQLRHCDHQVDGNSRGVGSFEFWARGAGDCALHLELQGVWYGPHWIHIGGR